MAFQGGILKRERTMEFRMDRKAVKVFHGFPPEDQNEGDAEHAAMSHDERLETAGFILRQYVTAVLNLPEIPRMDRSKVCIVRRGETD